MNRGGRIEGGGGAVVSGGGGNCSSSSSSMVSRDNSNKNDDNLIDDIIDGDNGDDDGDDNGLEDADANGLENGNDLEIEKDVSKLTCRYQFPVLIQNGKAVKLGSKQLFYRGSQAHTQGGFPINKDLMQQLCDCLPGRTVEIEVGILCFYRVLLCFMGGGVFCF